MELERDKRLDATRTLKNSEADLLKVWEDLKEMTRARDSTELGLTSAQNRSGTKQGAYSRLRTS